MGSTRAIDQIKELNAGHVKMKDPDHVNELLEKFMKGKKESLQVVADFDYTLSAHTLKGKECGSCHSALERSSKLCEKFRQKADALRAKYYPIELDPKLTAEEKLPLMIEWWTSSHGLLNDLNLNRNDISDIVHGSQVKLRENCHEFLAELDQEKIPLVIFSAGIGDIIEAAVKQQSRMYDNIHIVSNFMKFNKEEVMTGFKGELIHTFNKNERTVYETFPEIKTRENILLLGDSLGDLGMVDYTRKTNVLKVGFLNVKVEQRMEAYLDAFDIVLVCDETMDVARAIVDKSIH